MRAQWRAWLSVFEDSGATWVNDIWSARRAENKVCQLRSATAIGFQVPETVVTNDVNTARDFAQTSTAVLKSLSSAYFELSDGGFVFTQELTEETLSDAAAWSSQPMIVQSRVAGTNVRVVVVGERCFGACCDTTAVDWRTEGSAVVWRPWTVPDGLAVLCRAYNQHTGLRYAAFDFIDDGEDIWFLEANQAGEWLFIDRPLQLGISEAIADVLTALAFGQVARSVT